MTIVSDSPLIPAPSTIKLSFVKRKFEFVGSCRPYIFISIARAASTSIHRALGLPDGWAGEPSIYHASWRQIQDQYKGLLSERHFTFCVVRNPYERFYSLFCEFQRRIKKPRIIRYSRLKYIHDTIHTKCNGDFNYFCDLWADSEWVNDVHFTTAYDQISDLDDTININYIMKYEKLNAEWDKLQNILELRLPFQKIPRLRKSEGKNNDSLLNIYNSKSKKLIHKMYEKDFEYFQYK